jgi:predicted Kef-type K+ transport protein
VRELALGLLLCEDLVAVIILAVLTPLACLPPYSSFRLGC